MFTLFYVQATMLNEWRGDFSRLMCGNMVYYIPKKFGMVSEETFLFLESEQQISVSLRLTVLLCMLTELSKDVVTSLYA